MVIQIQIQLHTRSSPASNKPCISTSDGRANFTRSWPEVQEKANWLVVVSTPLKNMKVSWDDDIPNILWKIFQTCSKPPISQLIFRKPQEDSDDFKWIILKLSGEIPALFENCQPQSDAKRISHWELTMMIFQWWFSMMFTFRFFKLRDIIENHGTSLWYYAEKIYMLNIVYIYI